MACDSINVANTNLPRGSRMTRGPRGQKIIVLELCDERLFQTNGDGTYDEYLVGPTLEGIGPHIEDMAVHSHGREFTNGFTYKVIGEFSYDGVTWAPFSSAVQTERTDATYSPSTPHTDRSDYGLRIRFKMGVNDGGGSSKEQGTVSAKVAIKLWT